LAIVRSDDQTRRGGYVRTVPSSVEIGYNRAGVAGGFFYATDTLTQVGTQIGDDEDARIDFAHSNGSVRIVGEMDYYNSSQNALLMASDNAAGSSGVIVSYGATSTGSPKVLVTLYDPSKTTTNALAVNVTARSTTGFTASFNGNTGGSAELSWWAYRIN
jgi:hypothetical protein